MQAQTDILFIKPPPSRTPRRLQPPAQIMTAAIKRIHKWFAVLQHKHGVSVNDFMNYLNEREPGIKSRLDALYRAVDCDVHGRYLEGVLTLEAYREWRRQVGEWFNLFNAAIALYRLHHLEGGDADFAS